MVSLGIQMLFAQACPLPFVYVQMSFAHMHCVSVMATVCFVALVPGRLQPKDNLQ